MTVIAPPSASVLDALLLPMQAEAVAEAPVLFAGARAGAALQAVAGPHWICEQTFRPFALELERQGLAVTDSMPGRRFDRVLLLPPRQRDARRAAFARALEALQEQGVLIACVPNVEGARSAEDDLVRLAGPVQTLSKHKCRVFRVGRASLDRTLQAAWLEADAPRRNSDGYLSQPGLFAWDHVDPASALLAAHLPADLGGRVADLGAGYGYLAAETVTRCPGVQRIDLFEADARALPLADVNLDEALARAGRTAEVGLHWHDVTAGLPGRFDAVVSNPPFHQGRADLPDLGRAFIEVAADALRPGGRLWLVANRHLPYEATLAARFARVRAVASAQGFKVIEAVRA